MNVPEEPDFRAWAVMLLQRKIPQGCADFISRETIERATDILSDGGAFEVHLFPDEEASPWRRLSETAAPAPRVTVTPIEPLSCRH